MSKYAFLIALVFNALSIGASIDFPFKEGDKWLYASSFYQGPYPPTLFKGTSEFKIDSIRSVSDTSYQIFTRITNICSTPDTAFVEYFSFTWNNHGHIKYDNDYRPQFLNNCNGNDSCTGMPINSFDPSVNYNLGYSNIYGSTSMKLSYRLRTFNLTNSYALISMNDKEITTSAIAKKMKQHRDIHLKSELAIATFLLIFLEKTFKEECVKWPRNYCDNFTYRPSNHLQVL